MGKWDQGCLADVGRSPDDANVRNKMVFASSKDALRRRLDGELLLPFSAV
jgi:hypothetical protein